MHVSTSPSLCIYLLSLSHTHIHINASVTFFVSEYKRAEAKMLLNRWHLLNGFVLLHLVVGTRVKLNNGGFEDVVIAINPGIPEDNKTIDNIKVSFQKMYTLLPQLGYY